MKWSHFAIPVDLGLKVKRCGTLSHPCNTTLGPGMAPTVMAPTIIIDLTDPASSDCGGRGDWDATARSRAPVTEAPGSPVKLGSAAHALWTSLCDDTSAGVTEEHEVVARLATEDWEVVEGLVCVNKPTMRRASSLPRIAPAEMAAGAGSRRGGRRSLRRRMRNRCDADAMDVKGTKAQGMGEKSPSFTDVTAAAFAF